MSVRRKLFLAMGAIIVGMGLVFAFVSQVVQRGTLDVMVEAPKKERVEALTERIGEAYARNGYSWAGIRPADISLGEGESVVVESLSRRKRLFAAGEADPEMVTIFGIRSNVVAEPDTRTIAFLYYYDEEVGMMSRLRLGILDSATVLLVIGTLLFILVALFVAYGLSRRLTAPLSFLLPAIARLGKGEFGVQAPVTSKDEYGKVAEAFNDMSARLQRAEESRRNLVADAAHELRTPLTIIGGKLEQLQQHGEPVAPERLLPLQDDLIRLTRLVDELHQLSLAEAKRLPLERKPTDLYALLDRVVEHVMLDAEAKGVSVTLEQWTEATRLTVDPHRITQVFLNLLVNAVRYTPRGGTVRVFIDDAGPSGKAPGDRQGGLRVTVADTGPGIEAAHLPYLFDRFYRTDEARDRNSGGMGLGLAIVKELVHAHGGTIDVASEPGRGTVFAVTLPQGE